MISIDQPLVSHSPWNPTAADLCCFCQQPVPLPIPGPKGIRRLETRLKIKCVGTPCTECLNSLWGNQFTKKNDVHKPIFLALKAVDKAIDNDNYPEFANARNTIERNLSFVDQEIAESLHRIRELTGKREQLLCARRQLDKALSGSPNANYFTRRAEADAYIGQPEVRFAIFSRDGFKCLTCSVSRQLTVDHIKPVRLGGSDDHANLQTLCRQCNCRKGIKFDPSWIAS